MKNRSTDILSNLSAAIIYRSIPQRTAAESTARRALARPQATAPQPPSPQTSIPHHPRIPNKHIAGPRAPPAMNNLHSYLPANSSASPKEQTSPHSICSPLTNSLKTANILKWALWSWRQGGFSTGREEVAAEEVKMGKKEGREGKELRREGRARSWGARRWKLSCYFWREGRSAWVELGVWECEFLMWGYTWVWYVYELMRKEPIIAHGTRKY
jgi:hypothetical protein